MEQPSQNWHLYVIFWNNCIDLCGTLQSVSFLTEPHNCPSFTYLFIQHTLLHVLPATFMSVCMWAHTNIAKPCIHVPYHIISNSPLMSSSKFRLLHLNTVYNLSVRLQYSNVRQITLPQKRNKKIYIPSPTTRAKAGWVLPIAFPMWRKTTIKKKERLEG